MEYAADFLIKGRHEFAFVRRIARRDEVAPRYGDDGAGPLEAADEKKLAHLFGHGDGKPSLEARGEPIGRIGQEPELNFLSGQRMPVISDGLNQSSEVRRGPFVLRFFLGPQSFPFRETAGHEAALFPARLYRAAFRVLFDMPHAQVADLPQAGMH